MGFLTNKRALDRKKPLELVLNIGSFVAGENKIGQDHELKSNEARIIQNWDATSLGGMIRSKGFDEVGDGGGSYSAAADLLIQHYEGTNNEVYGIHATDLTILSGTTITQEDASAFTSGKLSTGVTFDSTLWITNSTDNLQYKTIGAGIATPTGVPTAKDRIYYHPATLRLVAEGGNDTVQGSMAGSGNWKATAGTWSTSNDSWSSQLPSDTRGCVMGFPGGSDISIFTDFDCTVLYDFPNVKQRQIVNSRGCTAPNSIAKGNEGVFFVSKYPTLGVFLWDSVNWINLTELHDFQESINLSQRIFGIYRNNKYHLFYNETGSGVTYPNRWRIYNAKYGRWMERSLATDLGDTFGYPALLTRSNNELYAASSQQDKYYDLETTATDDDTYSTVATYTTKNFSSLDFNLGTGGEFGIDDVRLKLTKIVVTHSGTTGTLTFQWTADRGLRSGSVTIDTTADGDLINSTFTVNSSKVVTAPEDKQTTRAFSNDAIGRVFDLQIGNTDTGTRPEIKRIKVYAIALEEA